MNNAHMFDATEIFRSLPKHQKEAYFKIAFYLVSFFYYLYRCVPTAKGKLTDGLTLFGLPSRMILAFVNESDL